MTDSRYFYYFLFYLFNIFLLFVFAIASTSAPAMVTALATSSKASKSKNSSAKLRTSYTCAHVMCNGCTITVEDMIVKTLSHELIYDFFVCHGNLRCSMKCPTCNTILTKQLHGKYFVFRCSRMVDKKHKKRCKTFVSTFKNTFFAKARLSLATVAKIVLFYLDRPPPRCRYISLQTGVSIKTLVDYFNFIREVLIFWAAENSEMIGGIGHIVEIDEAQIGRRKYNCGGYLEGQWIIGGIDRASKKFFLVAMNDRTSQTLVAIIKDRILPGTTIHSECWQTYELLSSDDFEHMIVHHSLNFVDSVTGSNTKNERTWVEARKLIPKFGRIKDHYLGYLAECLFMKRYPNHIDRLHVFWTYASKLFPGIV